MIPIIWHGQEEGRGYYNVTAMLNDLFDKHICEHFGAWRRMPEGIDGGVVIVHGSREQGRIEKLNLDIQQLKWVLLIFVGDEEASFPAEMVKHSNKIAWVQEPHPTRSAFADRLIINGCSHGYRKFLDFTISEKDLDWVFAGQVTHERRRACTNALAGIDWGGVIVETKGYCQGVSREEYFRLLMRAKIVPCPSGPMAQDTARPWEALECGAIPILDDFTPERREPGFWKMLLGSSHPFPVITDWSTLPQVINDVKGDWEYRSNICQEWWRSYKRDFEANFVSDVKALKEIACTKT